MLKDVEGCLCIRYNVISKPFVTPPLPVGTLAPICISVYHAQLFLTRTTIKNFINQISINIVPKRTEEKAAFCLLANIFHFTKNPFQMWNLEAVVELKTWDQIIKPPDHPL